MSADRIAQLERERDDARAEAAALRDALLYRGHSGDCPSAALFSVELCSCIGGRAVQAALSGAEAALAPTERIDDALVGLTAERDAALKRADEAEAENLCDACIGRPISGTPCMCGGTGKMSRAAIYLREQLCDARADLIVSRMYERVMIETLERIYGWDFQDRWLHAQVDKALAAIGRIKKRSDGNGQGDI